MTQPPLMPPPGQYGGQYPSRRQARRDEQSARAGQPGQPAQGPGQAAGQPPSQHPAPDQFQQPNQPPRPPQAQPPAPGQFPVPSGMPAPGQFRAPGQVPGQVPGQLPGQGRATQPGQFPGQQPSQYPGPNPNQHPGQQAGQPPGQQQFRAPGQAPFVQAPPSNLPAGAPPPRFAPQQQAAAQPKRRELGEDPELQKQRKRPIGLLVGIGLSGLAIVALVVGLFAAFNTSNDPTIPVSGGDPQAVTSTPVPTSTLMPAAPQDAVAGYIPITTDVVFPNGITVVNPSLGGWEQDISERQPNLFILSDPVSGAYFSVSQDNLHKSEYRDEDMTRSELNSASLQFTAKPEAVGDPVPLVVKGAGGYELEFLAQRLRWSDGSEGMMASRFMPSTGTKITILANAWSGELDDPTSRISQKVAELSFTTP